MTNRQTVASLLLGCVLLQGCATVRAGSAPVDVVQKLSRIQRAGEQDRAAQRERGAGEVGTRALDTEFREVMALCKDALLGFERKAELLSWLQFAIAIAGAVAGGIIGPYFVAIDAAKHAGIISAMSGTAGVANTAQQSLSHYALSNDAQREARQDVRTKAMTALAQYSGTAEQKEGAVAQAFIACTLLPGVVAVEAAAH
jgi:hypothetical protein